MREVLFVKADGGQIRIIDDGVAQRFTASL
jgi:hypothetical protein